jgi:cytochrome P450
MRLPIVIRMLLNVQMSLILTAWLNPISDFGGGRHICAGAPLARLEIAIAFRTLMSRLPDIRLVNDEIEYLYLDGTFIRPKSIEAVFTPSPTI